MRSLSNTRIKAPDYALKHSRGGIFCSLIARSLELCRYLYRNEGGRAEKQHTPLWASGD